MATLQKELRSKKLFSKLFTASDEYRKGIKLHMPFVLRDWRENMHHHLRPTYGNNDTLN